MAEALEKKVGYRLENTVISRIKRLEEEFLGKFWKYIPEKLDKVQLIASDVAWQLETSAGKSKYSVIGLDRIYGSTADAYLEVTRLTDPVTGEVRIGERPGSKPLVEQIKDLSGYTEIALVDSGAFEGDTLLEVCSILEIEGLEVKEIYLGVCSNKASAKINTSRKLTPLNLFNFFEWIELRDLFGIDGRNVGIDNGSRLYMPYWENLSGWASIPEENVKEVAELCKEFNRELINLLSQEGYDIKRIGTPVKYGGGR